MQEKSCFLDLFSKSRITQVEHVLLHNRLFELQASQTEMHRSTFETFVALNVIILTVVVLFETISQMWYHDPVLVVISICKLINAY